MKLKKRTRKQLLRLVAMVLFVAMIISSTAPIYAIHETDTNGTDAETFAEDTGVENNIIPATWPEDTTGNADDTAGPDTITPDDSAGAPDTITPDNPTGTPEQSAEPTEEPEAIPTQTPADSEGEDDMDVDVSPSAAPEVPGGSLPSDGDDTVSEGEPSESPSPAATESATPSATPTTKPTVRPGMQLDLAKRSISSTASDNAVVMVNGFLPEGATVSVHPTEVDLDGHEVLAAYDITILDIDGQKYEIKTPVTVTVSGVEALKELEGEKIAVYHMEDADTENPDKVANVTVKNNSVVFEATGFSVYALVKEQIDEPENSIMTLDLEDGEPDASSAISINEKADEYTIKANFKKQDGPFSRSQAFKFTLEYKFTNERDEKPTKNNPYAYFEIPETDKEGNKWLAKFMSGTGLTEGQIHDASGKVIGDFTITGNRVMFHYTDDNLLTNNNDFEGKFEFLVYIEETYAEGRDGFEFDFGGETDIPPIQFEEGNVTAYKAHERQEDGTIKFTVTFTVEEKDVTGVKITDILGAPLSFVEDSFTLDGNKVEAAIDKNTNTAIIGGEKGLDLEVGSHTLVYYARIGEDELPDSTTNTVQWTWDQYKEEEPKETKDWIAFQKEKISKSATQEKDRIKWTIEVWPESTKNVFGMKIEDHIGDGQKYDGTFKVYKDRDWYGDMVFESEELTGDSFIYVFDDEEKYKDAPLGKPYTIVYYTKPNVSDVNGKYTNDLNGQKYEFEYDAKKSGTVPDITTKSSSALGYSSGENTRIRWTIRVNPEDYPGMNEIKITDRLLNTEKTKSHYDSESFSAKYADGSGSLWIGPKIAEDGKSFTLTLYNLTKEVIITYFTEGSPGTEEKNLVQTEYSINGEPKTETDESSGSYAQKVNYPFEKSGKLINGNEVEWTLLFNEHPDNGSVRGAEVLNGWSYVITDTLPEGMEYINGSASYKISVSETYDFEVGEEGVYKPEYNPQTRTLTFDFGNIKEKYYKDSDWWTYITVTFRTKITRLPAGEAKFTNTAVVKENEVQVGSASAEVEIKNKIINKQGALKTDGSINRLAYTIAVNYAGTDLVPNSSTLYLTDVLDPNTTLDVDSIKVTNLNTGKKVDFTFSYDSSGIQGKMTLGVPDSTPLKITYEVTVIGKENQTITVKNSATLQGVAGGSSESQNKVKIEKADAIAGAGEGSITVKKIDSKTRKALTGATFELYRYKGQGDYADINSYDKIDTQTITSSLGTVVFNEDWGDTLQADQLYFLIETQAPSGYKLVTQRHYFMLKGNTFDAKYNALPPNIKKLVAGYPNAGYTYVISNDAQQTYKFTVKKVDFDTSNPLKGATFTLTKNGDSSFSRTLSTKDDGTLSFEGLLPGIYKLVETGAPDGGYDLPASGVEYTVEISATGGITYKQVKGGESSGSGTTITVSNKKAKGEAEFSVHKIFTNWQDDTSFTFILKPDGDADTPMPENAKNGQVEITIKKGDAPDYTKTFGPIAFIENGDYYYTITEDLSSKKQGIRYDITTHYIRVKVGDGGEKKKVTISVSTDDEKWTTLGEGVTGYTAEFTNHPEYGFSVQKVIAGTTQSLPGATFTLKKILDNDTTKEDKTFIPRENVPTDGEGKINFTGLLPGTYVLTEETAPAGYKKTNTTYTIEITDDGEITCTDDKENLVGLTELTDGTKALTVENERTTGSTEFFVKKSFDGWDIDTWKNETFSFTLISKDGNTPMPKGSSSNNEKTINDVKKGDATKGFGTIEFKDEGTYYYKIKENSPTDTNGITYDTTEYYVKVEVKNNGADAKSVKIYHTTDKDGWNAAEGKWTELVNEAKFTATFKNSYPTFEFSVRKVDENHNLLSGAKFTLKKMLDDNPAMEDTTFPPKENVLTNGEIDFTGLLPGTYELEETEAPRGYADSGVKYTITIDKDGSITYQKEGEEPILSGKSLELEVVNVKMTGNAEFSVRKTYDNWQKDGNRTFTFTLVAAEDKNAKAKNDVVPMPGDSTGKTTSVEITVSKPSEGATVRNTFKEIEFDKDGTYYYIMKESVPEQDDGILYDGKTYYIKVEVVSQANVKTRQVNIYVTTDEAGWDAATDKWAEYSGAFTADFVNNLNVGDLTVTKTIDGAINRDKLTDEQKAQISFTLKGPDGFAPRTFTYAEMVADGDDSITFTGLPAGEYTVTETNGAIEGYKVDTKYKVDGRSTQTVSVTVAYGEEPHEIEIINNYTLSTGSLKVVKSINGLVFSALDEKFDEEDIKFIVRNSKDQIIGLNGEVTEQGYTFTYADMSEIAGEENKSEVKREIILKNLPYGTYTVEEVYDGLDGYTVITKYTYTVKDGNGYSDEKAEVEIGTDNENPTVTVSNTYRRHGELTVTKHFAGDKLTDAQKERISFTLKGPNGFEPRTFTYAEMDEDGDGSITFKDLSAGDYTVTESNGIGGYNVTTEYQVGEGNSTEGTSVTVKVEDQKQLEIDFTNTYEQILIDIPVEKKWDDGNQQDGERPEYIKVYLVIGEEVQKDITLRPDGKGDWKGKFENLPTHDSEGNKISYGVKEELPEEYNKVSYESTVSGNATDGFVISNKHTPETIDVNVIKDWDKNGYNNLQLPGSITVILYAQVDGEEPTETRVVIRPNQEGKWEHTFTNLPVYKNGKKITYTVSEVEIGQYTSSASTAKAVLGEDGNYTIAFTNTYTPELISLPVEKVWRDGNNQDGIRPSQIIVELLADGKKTEKTITLGNGNWNGTFDNLRKYSDDGHAIKYTVSEQGITVPEGYEGAGYSVSYSGGYNEQTGTYELFTVTNTHTPATTEVEGKKIWDDDNDRDRRRPTEIEIKLVAKIGGTIDENLCKTKTISGTGDEWGYSFTNLPAYKGGKKITYEVIEVSANEGYTLSYNKDNNYELINSYTPGKTSIIVVKNWDDADNQDGVRPGSIEVKLYKKNASGVLEEVPASASIPNPVTLDKEHGWTYTWTGLPEKENGQTIEYWVQETTVPTGYTSSEKDGDIVKTGNTITITNHHKLEETNVDVEKKWNNGGYTNINIQHPNSVYVRLYAQIGDGDEKQVWAEDEWRVELSETNDWKHTFSKLPVKKDGQVIIYTIEEEEVAGPYDEPSITGSAAEGFIITNTYDPTTTSVDVTKDWQDNNDQDGIRPGSIKVQLKANGNNYGQAVELNDDNDLHYQWTNLPTVDGKGGNIEYTVEETDIPDSYGSTKTGGWNNKTGKYEYTITNTYTPQKTGVKVVKNWNDANDQDGVRPGSIMVTLYKKNADGDWEKVTGITNPVTLDKEHGWEHTWTNLPLKAGGKLIEYTVEESEVPEDYTTSDPVGRFNEQTGNYEFTITNTHTPAVTDIEVIKYWSDDNNNDGLRPASIKVQLKADGEVVKGQLELKAESWTGKWEGLPVYKNNGTRIIYTVEEVAVQDGYKVAYGGGSFNKETGTYEIFTVTNTYTAGTTDVSVKKIWNDGNNQDGKRPGSITVQLYADGTAKDEPVTLNEGNHWTYTWNNLQAKANGRNITYTIKESGVPEGYNVTYSGGYNAQTGTYDLFTITNTHTPETTEVTGTKTWNHGSNTDPDKQPKNITVILSKKDASGKLTEVARQSVGEEEGWSWSFTNLPKYENRKPITYVITEEKVEGYTDKVDGYNITNTYNEPKESPSPIPSGTPTPTPSKTSTPSEAPTPQVTATPVPSATPIPTGGSTPAVTPIPEESETPDSTLGTGDEPRFVTTPGSVETPEPDMEEPQVLRARRYQISGTEGMVLGARRGMEYAVLGMRRRPATGDSIRLLWWLLTLFTAVGGCITSGIMIIFNRKRK